MEIEDCSSSSGGTSDSEVFLPDLNDGENCYTSDDTPKLQFRKDISKARWNNELGMAEILDGKGRMWTTTGITHGSKIYCSVEETLFLAEAGALHLLDDDNTVVSLKDLYKKLAEGKSRCCWESFEVYRHLKSLGYIAGQHGIPWTTKRIKSKSVSVQGMPEINGILYKELEDEKFIVDLFNNMKINDMRQAFDVYPPNSKFKKSSPGNPSFVLFLPSGHPPSKPEIDDLERQCNGIPLKFCHVEHGRVSFFSFNKMELPVLP